MIEIINDAAQDALGHLLDGSVALTVTSPPYDNLRHYRDTFDGFTLDIATKIFAELYRVTCRGGVCVWVVADGTDKTGETGTSFRQALAAKDVGWRLHDTMIYEKAQSFGGSNRAYLHSFEYMFVFSKGPPKTFNAIRDRKNVRGGQTESTAKAGMRRDGSVPEREAKTAAEFGKRKNIWRYGVGGGKTGHPAVFPLKLAEDHILSWSDPGDTVIDPFCGSGTTAVAAINNGRGFWGCEIDPVYITSALSRIENECRQPVLKLTRP